MLLVNQTINCQCFGLTNQMQCVSSFSLCLHYTLANVKQFSLKSFT